MSNPKKDAEQQAAQLAAEGKGPDADPVTEQGRHLNEDLHDEPTKEPVLDRDQISQVNDPNLKR